jgi:hypothetical protein
MHGKIEDFGPKFFELNLLLMVPSYCVINEQSS